MEKWRRVWRYGLSPQLSTAGLQALRTALEADDKRLIQDATCYPPPLDALDNHPVEAACGITLCGWLGDGLSTVREADEFFQRVTDAADLPFADPASCRPFICWFDDTPRDEMRRELLPEVVRELERRQNVEVA